MLFLDFTSAFNTIIPQTLVNKLSTLGLAPSLYNWVLDFLTNRPQSVRINNTISSTIFLNTGSPQGCVLSPLLYTLFTHDYRAHCDSNLIVKFADDTAVVGLITNGHESTYRQEVDRLGMWCRENNLTLNNSKTKEVIVDFHKNSSAAPPLHINGTAVEVVPSINYLGVHLSNTLTWHENTMSLVKKAHQRLYFLRKLKGAGLNSNILSSSSECTDLLHRSLVLKLHRGREEGTAEGSKFCTKDHRMQLSTPLEHLHQPLH